MLPTALALAAAFSVPAWEPAWHGDYSIAGSCGSYTRPGYTYRGTLRIERTGDGDNYSLTWQTDRGAVSGSATSLQGQLAIEFRRADGEAGLMIASFAPEGRMEARGGIRGSDYRCSEQWSPATPTP